MCSSQKSQENRLQGRGEVKTEHGKHFFQCICKRSQKSSLIVAQEIRKSLGNSYFSKTEGRRQNGEMKN